MKKYFIPPVLKMILILFYNFIRDFSRMDFFYIENRFRNVMNCVFLVNIKELKSSIFKSQICILGTLVV